MRIGCRNPAKRIGTILLPGILLWLHAPFLFGYAKPSPDQFSQAALRAGQSAAALALLTASTLGQRWLAEQTESFKLIDKVASGSYLAFHAFSRFKSPQKQA